MKLLSGLMCTVFFLTEFLISSVSTAQSTTLRLKIGYTIAARLVAEGVNQGTTVRNLDYQEHLNHPFFEFYGITEVSSFGYFAVNPWTGDVWALWGCRRLSTPALRKSQAAIRRRFSPAELRQYPRLHRLKPECIVED
ncbi:MAG TPA: hypothetical protein VFC56_09150 [Stellaceae bacterium]|nr:hypothetical protein [Stellaceae bacterium]